MGLCLIRINENSKKLDFYYFTIQYTKYHGYPLFHTITPTISAFIAQGSSLNNINKQLIHKYIERVKYEYLLVYTDMRNNESNMTSVVNVQGAAS